MVPPVILTPHSAADRLIAVHPGTVGLFFVFSILVGKSIRVTLSQSIENQAVMTHHFFG